MAGFNPDAYLAKKQSQPQDFNPDAYLAAKDAEGGLDTEALRVGAEKGISFGARPFIAGTGAAIGMGAGLLAGGIPIGQAWDEAKNEFGVARQEAIDEQERLAKRSPLTSLAGEIGGAVLVPGSALKAITRGAKGFTAASRIGAAMGAGQALGEAHDLNEGLKTVGTGAVLGLGGEAIGKTVGAGVNAIQRKLESASTNNVIKASGGMLKDFRKIFGKNLQNDIADTALSEGVVKAGDDVGSVAAKAAEKANQYGEKIGSVYSQVDQHLKDPKFLAGLNEAQVKALSDTSLNSVAMAQELSTKIGNDLKGIAGSSGVVPKIQSELDTLAQLGPDPNMKDLVTYRRSVDNLINFDRSIKDQPLLAQQLVKIRNSVNDKIKNRVDAVDSIIGGELGQVLRQSNTKFSHLTQVEQMASDRVLREESNKALGLRQSILIGGGASAGAAASPEDRVKGAITGAALGASLKTVERYGPAILAQAENALARQLSESGVLRRMVKRNPQAYQALLNQTVESIGGKGSTKDISVPIKGLTGLESY
jgi:hypothetical protein